MAPATATARNAVQRLRADFAYWAQVCYRIRDKDGVVVPLTLNRAQRLLEEKERSFGRDAVRIFCLKARQGGVTTHQQAKNLHTVWSLPGAAVMTLAHSKDHTEKIFRITRRAVENFPAALLPTVARAQTKEVSFPGLDSTFWTGTAGNKHTGRGTTLRRLHCSEVAFWDDPLASLHALMPAMVPQGSAVVLETTASGYGSEAHGFWQESERGKNGFAPVFLPWWICDYEHYRLPLDAPDELGKLEPEERALVERHGVEPEQIKWRRETTARMGRGRFLQEYAEDPQTCWMVAGGLFYDAERVKYLLDRTPTTKRLEHVHGERWSGHVEVYADQEGHAWERERVIIGADTAEGGAGDRSAYVARTFPSGRLLEAFADNEIEPKVFAGLLCERGKKHADRLGPALLVPEKNAHGITVIREARDTFGYPVSRIYHRTVFDRASKQQTLSIGWATTGTRDGGGTQPLLLDAGREIINAACDGTYGTPSSLAVQDAYAVKRDEKGHVSLNGKDVLVAEMLAWLGRTYQISGVGGFNANI